MSKTHPRSWLPCFRRTLHFLRPHLRPLVIGLVAALGVGAFYAVSISSVIPLLKVIFSDHETLVDWMHRVETQRRLDVAIASDLPDDPAGLLIDHVRPESRSALQLHDGDRIVSIDGVAPGSYAIMQLFAEYRESELPDVVLEDYDGQQRTVQLDLRAWHWWSNKARGVASLLPQSSGPDGRLMMLMLIMGFLVLAAIFSGLFRLVNEGLVATAVQRAMHDLRSALAAHVFRLPIEWHSTQPPGDTLARFATDINKLETGLMTLFGKTIREPIKAGFVLVLLLSIEWKLLACALICLPVGVVAIRWFGRAIKRSQRRASQSWGRLLDHLGEKLAGIRIVKAYSMQGAESDRFRTEGLQLTQAQTHIEVVDAATKPVLEILAAVAAAGFVIYGGSRVFGQQLEPALFFTALACLGGIFDPVRRLGNVNNRLNAADASARRVFDLFDTPEEEPPSADAHLDLPQLKDAIEFCDVGFTYPGAPRRVLSGIDLSVPRGQVVALVGPNGSGKTTLMSLLMRFYRPTRGTILIDGHDLNEYSLESLRRQIGLVTQDAVVFSDSVYNNIAYGANGETDLEAVRRAASRAHIDRFVQSLGAGDGSDPASGYDAQITARSLSGGQRQRLALARAILRDPEILILDEATSQIDSESEAQIQEALEEVTRDRTTFVIAHRFSTISRADVIAVLNEGQLVATGTHDELMACCPFYSTLCQSQFAVGA